MVINSGNFSLNDRAFDPRAKGPYTLVSNICPIIEDLKVTTWENKMMDQGI